MNRSHLHIVAVCTGLAMFACSDQQLRFYKPGMDPKYPGPAGDVLDDPTMTYRDGPGGFPLPVDAIAEGPAKFSVPRHYHRTARMQEAKLEALGFSVETSRPSGWAYKLQAKKGDKRFIATIATPRGPDYTDSSTIEITEAQ